MTSSFCEPCLGTGCCGRYEGPRRDLSRDPYRALISGASGARTIGVARSMASLPPESGARPLRVFLLGNFRVDVGGVEVPAEAWKRRRPVDVLVLVAISPQGALL